MSAPIRATWRRFEDLVFSDLQRYRPDEASWLKVAIRCLTLPGMIASVIVRGQQCLWDSGRKQPAMMLRTLGLVLVGMDSVPGADIGPGLLIAHPNGVTIGNDLTIGRNVSFAGGVTCAARYPDPDMIEQEFATIGDDVVVGAHVVLVGPVKVGNGAMIGSNAVVLSDVPELAVMFGSPAKRVGTRPDKQATSTPDTTGEGSSPVEP